TGVYHRLNGYHHTFFQFGARSAPSVVGYFGLLVQVCTYAVAYQFAHYAKTVAFGMLLYCKTYIAYAHAGYGFLYATVKAFACYTHQLFGRFAYLANGTGKSRVAVVFIEDRPAINRHHIAL